MAEKMLDRHGVAALLGVSPETAYNLMRQMRRIPVTKTGASKRPRYMVTESEITRWQNQCMMNPGGCEPPEPVKKKPPILYDANLFEPDGRIKRRRSTK